MQIKTLNLFDEKSVLNFLIISAIVFAATVNNLEGWSSLSSLCGIVFLFLLYLSNRSFYFLKALTPLVIFSVYSFLTFFWGGSLDYAQKVATAILVGAAVLLGLRKKAISIEAVTFALILAGGLNIWSSRDNLVVADVDEYRVEGMIGNPNALAIFLSLTAFVILYAPLKFPKITKLIAVFFMIYSLLFTGSRKGLFLIVVTILYGLCSYLFGSSKSRLKNLVRLLISVVLFISLVVLFFRAPAVLDDLSQVSVIGRTQHMLDGKHNVRYDMIAEGMRLWTESPIFGWGAGQFAQLTIFQTYSHNNYVETLANYGLFGFFLYYAFYLNLIQRAVIQLRRAPKDSSTRSNSSTGLIMLIMLLVSEWGLVTLGSKSTWIFLMIAAFLVLSEQKSAQKFNSI